MPGSRVPSVRSPIRSRGGRMMGRPSGARSRGAQPSADRCEDAPVCPQQGLNMSTQPLSTRCCPGGLLPPHCRRGQDRDPTRRTKEERQGVRWDRQTARPRGPHAAGSPCGEGAAVCDAAWACRRSSAVWLFLGLRSGFAVLIFLGRPRFRPAIFRPFLFSFFFRALEGDGFLMVVAPAFSSSAPES